MFQQPLISPSILSADFMNMQRDIAMIEQAGTDWIHVDVMDGHFVPNLTLGVPFVKQLRSITTLPIDVHLMISNPLEQLPWFIETKPDYLTVHYEALDVEAGQVNEAIDTIRNAGIKCGLSIKPDTPVAALNAFIRHVDMVLVMSVYPGFSGQSFIPESVHRVGQVADLCRQHSCNPIIQVDGGISAETVASVAQRGADCFVAGSAVFGAPSPADAIADIKRMANEARMAACDEQ